MTFPISVTSLINNFLDNPSTEPEFLEKMSFINKKYFDGQLMPQIDVSPSPPANSSPFLVEDIIEDPVDVTSDSESPTVISPSTSPEVVSTSSYQPPYQPVFKTLSLQDVTGINAILPFTSSYFQPSALQSVILNHLSTVRSLTSHSTGLLVLATALGKTIITILDLEQQLLSSPFSTLTCYPMIEWEPCMYFTKQFKCLFLVHSTVIQESAFAKFKRHFKQKYTCLNNSHFKFFSSESPDFSESESNSTLFVFCLWQSFSNLPDYFVQSITHLIVDEVHHIIAPTYASFLSDIRSVAKSLYYELGLTATLIHREDPQGFKLRKLFKDVVYVDLNWISAIKLNIFPKVEFFEVVPGKFKRRLKYSKILSILQSSEFKNAGDDRRSVLLDHYLSKLTSSIKQMGLFQSTSVKERVCPVYVASVIEHFIFYRQNQGLAPRNRILVFARNIKSADEIVLNLNNFGIKSIALHSKSSKSLSHTVNSFAEGLYNVLVTVGMVLEGFDLPSVDCLVMSRQTQSEIVFTQMMGRVLRKSSNLIDENVTVLDLTLSLRRRWERLRDDLTDLSLIEQILNFWKVQTFAVEDLLVREESEEEEVFVVD
ncbi:hypothetical protein GEMRC1_007379 [Eukaryota sp. GEM-RC1]